MTDDEINNIEYSYIRMHHLMNVLELIINEMSQTEHLSDNIIFLYKVIKEKRNKFHTEFVYFLTKLMKEV